MSVSLTEAAAEKILSLLAKDENANMHLRIFVSGGGCSGYQYGFSFEEEAQSNDELVESLGVKLLVDQMSMEMLKGSEVDYKTSIQGESFVIRNPNAAGGCGCGKSFSPSEKSGGCAHAEY